jgi:hypothetical protein
MIAEGRFRIAEFGFRIYQIGNKVYREIKVNHERPAQLRADEGGWQPSRNYE